MHPPFSRLIRFLSTDKKIYNGDAILPPGTDDISHATHARLITGSIFSSSPLSSHPSAAPTLPIKHLLPPLSPSQIPTLRCLGLNYALHAQESSLPPPTHPILFYKPSTAITGPRDVIPIPRMAQEGEGLDWECELVVVMGKQCFEVTEKEALEYVLGYAVGNDVSHRGWQLGRGGGQWSLGKGFDGWAPFGPGVVSAELIKDPQALRIQTRVNGRVVQDSSTADMIFSVAKIISFLSQGTTLLPGDLIFTGTPQGVGMGMKPQVWLKDGDVVEVSLEGVGTCTNKIVFAKSKPKL